MITAAGLSFSYDSGRLFRYPDFQCSVTTPLLISGRSGSGKTTLLHLLGCLLAPVAGTLTIKGIQVQGLTEAARDAFRGKYTGIIFQQSHFMQALPVLDNILLSQYFSGHTLTPAKAKRIAARLEIAHLLDKLPATLSQGEQQRVSIARALLHDPALLLADEPTSSLDDESCEQVVQLLLEQSHLAGAALVMVTHDARVKQYFKNRIHLA